MFNGKTHYVYGHLFNSYVTNYQRVQFAKTKHLKSQLQWEVDHPFGLIHGDPIQPLVAFLASSFFPFME